MTKPGDDLLITSEGVDEGSAASTQEGSGGGSERSPEEVTTPRDPNGRTLGEAPASGAESDATPAPPVDMESESSRGSREQAGSGQQLQAGEG